MRDWQKLAPGDLPAKHLKLNFHDFNPRENLLAFDFAGFVEMNALSSPNNLANFAHYSDAHSAAQNPAVTGQNYYGPLFFIQIDATSIALEDYCLQDTACQETAQRLLKYLAVELDLKFTWQAYSWYYDNHERSALRRGSEAEIRALFDAI